MDGTGKAVWRIIITVLAIGMSVSASAVNEVTITLLNSTYNRPHDVTEFRYRVSGAPDPDIRSWVLQIADCIEDSEILFTDKPCSWVTEPLRGLRFDVPHVTTTYHLRLSGYWDTASLRVAVLKAPEDTEAEGRGEQWSLASVTGPGCSTWMSLEVLDGEAILFPEVTGAGSYSAGGATVLRVTCSVDSWLLDRFAEVTVPPGGDPDAVYDALSIAYDPFVSAAGTTDVTARYRLTFDQQDFSRLPSGDYRIVVVYTLIAPD